MRFFASPEWPQVVVDFDVHPSEAAGMLAAAAEARTYSEPDGRNSLGYLRLGGEVDGANVDLTATPYVHPGFRAGYGTLPMRLRGRISRAPGGSQLSAQLTAPLPPVGLLALGAWIAFLMVTAGSLAVVLLFAPAIPLSMIVMRHNQRQAFRWRDDVVNFLRQLVVAGSGSGRIT